MAVLEPFGDVAVRRLEAAPLACCRLEPDARGLRQAVLTPVDRWVVLATVLLPLDLEEVRRKCHQTLKPYPHIVSGAGNWHVHVIVVLLWLAGLKVRSDAWDLIVAKLNHHCVAVDQVAASASSALVLVPAVVPLQEVSCDIRPYLTQYLSIAASFQ